MKLDDVARAALKKYKGDVDKALPEFVLVLLRNKNLVDEMARQYLYSRLGPQSDSTGAKPAKPAGPIEVPPLVGSIKVRKHDVREHPRRTHEERLAAERLLQDRAERFFEIPVNGRPLGNIAIGELREARRERVDDASSWLMHGIEQARLAVLLELVEMHCQAPDQLMRVRDAISAEKLAQLVLQAEEEAPRRIAEAIRRARGAIGRDDPEKRIAP